MTVVIHRAKWVMTGPGQWLENGAVAIEDGRILQASACCGERKTGKKIDHGEGVLMPALVNAHTHLSLSALAGKIPVNEGFSAWIRALISERINGSEEEALRAVHSAVDDLKRTGTGLLGEFGPHIPVAESIEAAGLRAMVWFELIGNDQVMAPLPADNERIHYAYAGHAPNTTSPSLLARIKKADILANKPFCMHLAESREEVEFLETGKGTWADLMTAAQIDFSSWKCFGNRPVELAFKQGLLDTGTLAVHLLEVTPREIELLAKSMCRVCLCPRSNWTLHRKLPDMEGFLEAGINPALGTDSLASVTSLDLFDEMEFIAKHYPGLSPDTILALATVNGATVLGDPEWGLLKPGNRAQMIYIDINAKHHGQAAEQLVSGGSLKVHFAE
jgi:cytosine/adenosine deaminase-related metal-dependent hydrolase